MRQILFALVLVAGCANSERNDATNTSTPSAPVALTGAGATFPYPLYSDWISTYEKSHADVRINYQAIGSGGGIRQITERTVDFGASDAPMSDEQLSKAEGVVHVPTCLGAVVLAYHPEGWASELKLSPSTVSGIFLGTITKWNDSAIVAENPGTSLPEKAITTVHRSDGSGTTKIFTDWLSATSAPWKAGPGSGTAVSWPGGLAAKGNDGVTALVQSTPGSIGYVELAYAAQNKLAIASIRNRRGHFVAPSIDGVTAAGASVASTMPEDMRVSIVDADGDAAYPVSGFTYVLLRREQSDVNKGRALVSFLRWATHDGQQKTRALNYAPLPPPVVTKIDAALRTIHGPGGAALTPVASEGAR
jgi:phosphate transport system substrate-binding protein